MRGIVHTHTLHERCPVGDQEVLVFEGFAPLISEKIFTGPVQPLLKDRDDCRVERDATVLTGLCFIAADQDSGYNVYILLFTWSNSLARIPV